MGREVIATEYVTYSVLYSSTIICNKYVLTSLGFQYPTIFQAWQMLVGVCMMHMISGFQIREIVLRDILPWLPAMMLYVGAIFSGSIALSQLPIPIFIVIQGCGDVILILCNDKLPSTFISFSYPIRLAAAILISWFAIEESRTTALIWLIAHTVFSGVYRSISFWYSTPYWPYSNLTIQQRQYLNYFFSFAVLLPSIFIFGHHEKAKYFPHLSTNKFYIGSVCSGVFGWAVNKLWMKVFFSNSSNPKALLAQLASKVLVILLSMILFHWSNSWSVVISILLSLIADVLQIFDSFETDHTDHIAMEEMHDVLVSF